MSSVVTKSTVHLEQIVYTSQLLFKKILGTGHT